MTNDLHSNHSGIFWLASYPKSGNTWVRAFISCITNENNKTININELNTGSIASDVEWVENGLGFEISELNQDEIELLRPYAYHWLSKQTEQYNYHKVHDAYTYLANGKPLFPTEATKGVLYIARNPLDVAISFAHHAHISIDKAIEIMGDPNYAFCNKSGKLPNQLRQRLLTWSQHVASWIEAPNIRRLLVRYEDMKLRPLETFSQVTHFLELNCSEDSISQALEQCKIEKLQQQEHEHGFKEKSYNANCFFRKGIVGDWVTTLTPNQTEKIVNHHKTMMRKLGYLDRNNKPITFSETV